MFQQIEKIWLCFLNHMLNKCKLILIIIYIKYKETLKDTLAEQIISLLISNFKENMNDLDRSQIRRTQTLAQSFLQFTSDEQDLFRILIQKKFQEKNKEEHMKNLYVNQQELLETNKHDLQGLQVEHLKQKLNLFPEILKEILQKQIEAAPQQTQTEVKEEEKIEKTSFDVELESFDAKSKLKIIKEIKTLLKLGLKESKELVEKSPIVIREGINKQEAEELQKVLEKLGAKITIKQNLKDKSKRVNQRIKM